MDDYYSKDKTKRVLSIHDRLMRGYVIDKVEEAQRFGVNERTIQRDIDDIRSYLAYDNAEHGITNDIVYDRVKKGFCLKQIYSTKFTNSEILAICKILLDSRAFTKNEMHAMLMKMVDCCVPVENRKVVLDLIKNEEYHYVELQHKRIFLDKLWEIGTAIRECRIINMEYRRMENEIVERRVKPVSIMFSEYYFYMIAFIDSENFRQKWDGIEKASPAIYRIDRIQEMELTKEHFMIPYKDKFEEGEFRKRIQFMYGGKLKRVKFKYRGKNVEAVLDRLPTAKILKEENGIYTISAEAFGTGIDMWLRSQGDMIEEM